MSAGSYFRSLEIARCVALLCVGFASFFSMKLLRLFALLALLCLWVVPVAFSQTNCPPNIDFEFGNLQNWNCYTSTNGGSGVYNWNPAAPISNRHAIVTGAGVDPYGGFPMVGPGGGAYSLKLGNSATQSQMEQVRYTFTVPANQDKYAIIYRYAIVLEDPGHPALQQPFFKVRAYNATTGAIVNCGSFNYVSSSALPGFTAFNVSGSKGYYKNWATASMDLSGQAGNTITLEFSTSDCSQSAHFGYAYVDMSCGLFAIQNTTCSGAASVPLSAPPGFQTYTWYDSTYTTVLGSGQNISVTNPSQRTVYRVKLVPFPGYGCTDTLSSAIVPAVLTVDAGKDTVLCNQSSVSLSATATGSAPPFSYSWTSASGFSCNNCPTPTVTPATATSYFLEVTDSNNCIARDTVMVTPTASLQMAVNSVSCFGGNDGSISTTVQNGAAPFTYLWSNAQTGAITGNLTAGSYSVTLTDARGCALQQTAIVPQPAASLLATAVVSQSLACNGDANGAVSVQATGGTPPYTYSWDTTPALTTPALSGLAAGTYIATVTDAKGCVKTAQVVLVQPDALGLTLTGANINCNGGADGTITAVVTGGTLPYTYSWNTTPAQTTAAISSLGPGSYTVNVTDANGCHKTTSTTISQPSTLSVTASGVDVTCHGSNTGSATVTASGGTAPYIYSWNTIPVQTGATASNLVSGNYTATVTDANGCSRTASVVIGTPPPLNIPIAATAVSCNGTNNGSATVTASGGTAPYTYSWNTTPVQTGATASNLAAGNYTLTVTDARGCTKTASATVSAPTGIVLALTQTNISCHGSHDGIAVVNATGGTAPYNYSWNTVPVNTTALATGLTAGTYTVGVTDSKGCTKAGSVTITEPAVLAVSATATNVSCNGLTNGSAIVTATGGTTPYTFNWNTLPPLPSSIGTAAAISNLAPGVYTATIADSRNCQAAATLTIRQPPVLTVQTTTTNPKCYGGNNGTATVTAAGGTAPYTYSWNTTPTQTTATASGLAAGSYSVKVTDASNCMQTASVTLAQPDSLKITLSSSPARCHNTPDGMATATVQGGTAPYAYVWDHNASQTASSYSNLLSGIHTLQVTDAQGCIKTGTVIIAGPPPITGTLVVDSIPCFGAAAGSMHLTGISGGIAPYQGQWLQGGGTGFAAQGLRAGSHTVRVTDAAGCTADFTQLLVERPNMNLNAGKDTTICGGAGAPLRATGGGLQWQWSPAANLSCTACANPVATPAQTSTYVVRATDGYGCTAQDSVTVQVQQRQAVAAGPEQKVCSGDSVTLSASGGDRYEWSPAKSLQFAQTAQPLAAPTAETQYQVLVFQGSCFVDTLYQWVRILPRPQVDAGTNVKLFSGAQVTLRATGSADVKSIHWTPAAGLNCTSCWSPTILTARPATYTATVTNEQGCRNSDTVRIETTCDADAFYIANTFTPNGDGKDDRFYVQGMGLVKINRMLVQSKWGEVVFEKSQFPANDAAYGWDGTFGGRPMDSGTFLYVIEALCASGEPVFLKGDINLMR